MLSKSSLEFQQLVLKEMTFSPFPEENRIIYKNESRPEFGHFIKYSRKGYYDFSIGIILLQRIFYFL